VFFRPPRPIRLQPSPEIAPDAARLALWGLGPGRNRPDIPLDGSPERCRARLAVEDDSNRLWVLERLGSDSESRRERIGRTLASLAAAGLPVPAYVRAPDGRFVARGLGCLWQLAPLVPGEPLPQPDYVDDEDRGVHLGRFLTDLRRTAPEVRNFNTEPGFSLPDYARQLMAATASRQPEVHEALTPAITALAPLFEAWDDLPTALCHGDFHPGNIIWRGYAIASVIDWEFAGVRPRLFDTANCLGCVAAEDPRALVWGLAPALLRTLRDGQCLDDQSLALLPELVLGLRLAWMSEWLRRDDREMIAMELRLMRLLANSLDTLLPAWRAILG
jgi:homoserine kinase type II